MEKDKSIKISERRIRANDSFFNSKFQYAVSNQLLIPLLIHLG